MQGPKLTTDQKMGLILECDTADKAYALATMTLSVAMNHLDKVHRNATAAGAGTEMQRELLQTLQFAVADALEAFQTDWQKAEGSGSIPQTQDKE